MNRRKIIVLTAMVGLLCFLACKEEIIYTGLTGELMGWAYLQDFDNYTGDQTIVVSLTNNMGVSRIAYTDSSGLYKFSDLETGIYDLSFTKDSFSTFKINSYQFIGGEIPEYIYGSDYRFRVQLWELPYVNITKFYLDTIYFDFNPTLSFKATINVSKKLGSYRLFFGNSDQVSYTHYITTLNEEYFQSRFLNDTTLQISLPARTINGFNQGETVYVRMYPSPSYYYAGVSTYVDKETGLDIYSVNTEEGSEVVKFTKPKTVTYY